MIMRGPKQRYFRMLLHNVLSLGGLLLLWLQAGCDRDYEGMVYYRDQPTSTTHSLRFFEEQRYSLSTNMYPVPRWKRIEYGVYQRTSQDRVLTLIDTNTCTKKKVKLFFESKRNRFQFMDDEGVNADR